MKQQNFEYKESFQNTGLTFKKNRMASVDDTIMSRLLGPDQKLEKEIIKHNAYHMVRKKILMDKRKKTLV